MGAYYHKGQIDKVDARLERCHYEKHRRHIMICSVVGLLLSLAAMFVLAVAMGSVLWIFPVALLVSAVIILAPRATRRKV